MIVVRWLSAGLLTIGLSTAMLTGVGIAAGQTESDGGGSASNTSNTSTSQSGSQGAQENSDDKSEAATDPDPTAGDDEAPESEPPVEETDDPAPEESEESDEPADEESTDNNSDTVVEEETNTSDGATEPDETVTDTTDTSAAKDGIDNTDNITPDKITQDKNTQDKNTQDKNEAATAEPVNISEKTESPEPTGEPAAAPEPAGQGEQTFATFKTESVEAEVMMTAAPEIQQATGPTFINILGTLAWTVLDFVIKLFDLPPVIPPTSSVMFGRSQLEIDCGDGYTADADWYFPKEGQPEKFIYFQHGFPARAFVYDVTLRELAERNNAIVLAPSITANYFACDGCSLTADPMHEAVARLFEGDREALLASAIAGGYQGTLPDEFVIAGQSAGSILAAGASGYYYENASDAEKANLVGVLLYDGSAANDALGRALDKLPASVPVLHVAGKPAVINFFGGANKVLQEKRPGQFNGVQLVNGAHSDAFQSSAFFGLVQVFVGIAFGQSTSENVEAVQVLSQGWLTDMYAHRVYDPNTRTGIYGDPGQPGEVMVDIPTDAGLAQGYVLPGPTPTPSPIELFIASLLHSINANDYVTCTTQNMAAAACSPGGGQTQI